MTIETNEEISPDTHRTSEATATEEVLIEAMDSFNNDNATLLQRQTKINSSKETSISTSTCNEPIEHERENLSATDANEISIKLKFINDDQKMVTGSLKELLANFKRYWLIFFQIQISITNIYIETFTSKILYIIKFYIFAGDIFKQNLMHKN